MKLENEQKKGLKLLKVLEATLSYFKQWLKVLKMGIFSSVGWMIY